MLLTHLFKGIIIGGIVGSLMSFADLPSKQKPAYASFLGATVATLYIQALTRKNKLDKQQVLNYLDLQKKKLAQSDNPDSQYELAALFAVEDRIKEDLNGSRTF